MPRRRRLILPGFPHHVTHRGNRHADIFRQDEDHCFYLEKLAKYLRKYAVRLYAYCLMTNHVHLIPVPESRSALSQCLHDLHGLYADYFNRKYRLSGHLWQERFFACVLDDSHLWNAIRYVARNPARAGILPTAESYRWSSAQAHCGLRKDDLPAEDFPPAGLIPDWRLWLQTELSAAELKKIRSATHKGIPFASTAFTQELESLLGIPLLPRQKGRPPKRVI